MFLKFKKGIRMNINLVTRDDSPSIADHQNILIGNLEQLPNNICKSIIINGTFNVLNPNQCDLLIHKIRHNGILQISSVDAMELAFAFTQGSIDINQFTSFTQHSQQQHTLLETKVFLEQRGYIIETAGIKDLTFYIKAKRP
jgi:hypothetical protein